MIGFVIAGVAILVFGWLLYRMEQKKRNDKPSHHIISDIPGFPVIHVPAALSRAEAETLSNTLAVVYERLWVALDVIYGVYAKPMPIAVIGCTLDDVDPDHKHVRWMAPTDRIYLKIEDDTPFWFAMECHNVFRYVIHGMKGIYRIMDDDDAIHARKAGRWIEDNIGRKDER